MALAPHTGGERTAQATRVTPISLALSIGSIYRDPRLSPSVSTDGTPSRETVPYVDPDTTASREGTTVPYPWLDTTASREDTLISLD